LLRFAKIRAKLRMIRPALLRNAGHASRRSPGDFMSATRDLLYFVGSIPLKSSEDVFRQISKEVGPFLRRIPDGETGERTLWIKFQQKRLLEHPAIEVDPTQPPLPVNRTARCIVTSISFG
jgi:hypothetical protein